MNRTIDLRGSSSSTTLPAGCDSIAHTNDNGPPELVSLRCPDNTTMPPRAIVRGPSITAFGGSVVVSSAQAIASSDETIRTRCRMRRLLTRLRSSRERATKTLLVLFLEHDQLGALP